MVVGGKLWGVETLSVAERHYKVRMAGVEQFGGNNDAAPVLPCFHDKAVSVTSGREQREHTKVG